MSFKIHLLFISVIIVVVYLAWQYLNQPPASPQAVQFTQKQQLIISHASWGLNCPHNAATNGNSPSGANDAYARKETKNTLHEDNVLAPIAKLCNGQFSCDISIDNSTLGDDPASDCNPKSFDIEYRCFSYDVPRTATTMSKALTIDCNHQ